MRDITLQVVAGSLWRGSASLISVTDPCLISTLLVGLRHTVNSLVWNGKVKSSPHANCHLLLVRSHGVDRSRRRDTRFLKCCWWRFEFCAVSTGNCWTANAAWRPWILKYLALPVLVRDCKASFDDFEVSLNEFGLFLQPFLPSVRLQQCGYLW